MPTQASVEPGLLEVDRMDTRQDFAAFEGEPFADSFELRRAGYPRTEGLALEPFHQEPLAEIDQLISERLAAKKERDFDTADRLQEQLRYLGVEMDDRERVWRYKYDGGRQY